MCKCYVCLHCYQMLMTFPKSRQPPASWNTIMSNILWGRSSLPSLITPYLCRKTLSSRYLFLHTLLRHLASLYVRLPISFIYPPYFFFLMPLIPSFVTLPSCGSVLGDRPRCTADMRWRPAVCVCEYVCVSETCLRVCLAGG